jgi:hypothetical protein
MAGGHEIFFFALLSEVFSVTCCDVGEGNDFHPQSADIEFFQLFVPVSVVCEHLESQFFTMHRISVH